MCTNMRSFFFLNHYTPLKYTMTNTCIKHMISTPSTMFVILLFSNLILKTDQSRFPFNHWRMQILCSYVFCHDAFSYGTGRTNLSLALGYAHSKYLSPTYGARENARKVMMLITDGMSLVSEHILQVKPYKS